MPLDADSAARIIAACDAALAARRQRRDAQEEQRWVAEHGDDSVVLLALQLDRLANRLDVPSPAPILSDDDAVIRSRQLDEIAEMASELAESLERLCDHEEAEAAGVPRRQPVLIGPRVRSPHLLDRDPAAAKAKTVDGNGKSRKLSRTELHLQKQEAELQARQALVVQSQQESGQRPAEGVWRLGNVQKYDSRSMSGAISFGSIEAPFGAAAFRKSGLVSLHPTQKMECLVVTLPDGGLSVVELKLSADGRTVTTEAERKRAEEAEDRYRVELLRRGLH